MATARETLRSSYVQPVGAPAGVSLKKAAIHPTSFVRTRRRVVTMAEYGFKDVFLQKLKKGFSTYDQDNSGTITSDELSEYMQREVAANYQAIYDTDKDGKITWDEFVKATVRAKYGLDPAVVKVLKEDFDSFDTNGSGEITADEIRKLPGFAKVIIPGYDTNKDTKVTWEEFVKAYADSSTKF